MSVLLGFTGDVFLGSQDGIRPFANFAGKLDPQIKLVVAFEGTLCDDLSCLVPQRSKILLNSPAHLLDVMSDLPVAITCVGNNHINDYGNDVARFTIDALGARYPTFGAGYANDDFHLLVHAFDGVTMGFSSYCTADTSPIFCSASRIGPRELTVQQVKRDVKQLKQEVDHCVALVHWGDEYFHHPKSTQVKLGQKLVEYGFDLVVGSHSHSVQGYADYGGTLVFHSLGNFSFPDYWVTVGGRRFGGKWMPRCLWGIVPLFRINRTEIKLDAIQFVRQTRSGIPNLVLSIRLERRLRRFSEAIDAPDFAAKCERRRRIDAVGIRFEEFWVREDKATAVLNKVMRLMGFHRPGGVGGGTSCK